MKKVYLAGPVEQTSPEKAVKWRAKAWNRLKNVAEVVDPLRGHFSQLTYYTGMSDEELGSEDLSCKNTVMHFSKSRLLGRRCFEDVKECDIVLVNFEGYSEIKSIGTLLEIGAAYAFSKPIVLISDKSSILKEHIMLREAVSLNFDSLNECLNMLPYILS